MVSVASLPSTDMFLVTFPLEAWSSSSYYGKAQFGTVKSLLKARSVQLDHFLGTYHVQGRRCDSRVPLGREGNRHATLAGSLNQ